MRERAEDEIGRGRLPLNLFNGHKVRQRVWRKLRKYVPHLLPRAAIGREQHNVDQRMPEQKAHQLGAGIAGSTQHRDALFLDWHILLLAPAIHPREVPLKPISAPALSI
jgi:hypothetical protein